MLKQMKTPYIFLKKREKKQLPGNFVWKDHVPAVGNISQDPCHVVNPLVASQHFASLPSASVADVPNTTTQTTNNNNNNPFIVLLSHEQQPRKTCQQNILDHPDHCPGAKSPAVWRLSRAAVLPTASWMRFRFLPSLRTRVMTLF